VCLSVGGALSIYTALCGALWDFRDMWGVVVARNDI